MVLFQIEFILSSNKEADFFAYIIAPHVPRIGEHVAILEEKNKGYNRYLVDEIEYMFDATDIKTINELIQVGVFVTPLGKA